MKQQTLIQLALIFGIFVMLLFGKNLWESYREKKPNDYQQKIAAVKPEEVKLVLISLGERNLELIKEEDGWKVGSKSADKSKVTELIEGFFPVEPPVLLSETEDQLKNLGITDNTLEIKLASSKELMFRVGNAVGSAYAVNIVGDSKTYSLRSIPAITVSADDWYDLTIIDIDSSVMTKVQLESDNSSYALVIDENRKWRIENEEKPSNSDAILTYLYKYNPLKAQGLFTAADMNQYSTQPEMVVTITTDGNAQTKLEFYKGSSEYLVKRVSDGEMFLVESDKAESILKTKDTFIMPTG